MHDAPKPDSFEKLLRFGCGFVFGALVAFLGFAAHVTEFAGTFLVSLAIVANFSGVLAMRCGDRFWHNLLN